jgi:hypothetical protein
MKPKKKRALLLYYSHEGGPGRRPAERGRERVLESVLE